MSVISREAILQAFQFRHATKAFNPEKKISDEDFNFILETGRLSPSSFGFEPWKFLVIQNPDVLTKIKEIAWGARGKIPDASHFVVMLARTAKDLKYDSEYLKDQLKRIKKMPEDVIDTFLNNIQKFEKEEYHLLDNERSIFDWACKQVYIALGNMMTAAAMIGIDSCPIEGYNYNQLNNYLSEEGLLEEGHLALAVMVAFGYRAAPPRPKTRKPIDEVVQWVK